MICSACQAENRDVAEVCFQCGRGLATVTQGTVVAGRYTIQGVLGEGGMGIVYQAHDQMLDETVALKMLRPRFARTPELALRFRSEIKLARKVSHRNVCRIHEYGEDGRLRYICMEFVDGVNLKNRVAREGGLDPREAYPILLQVCGGLEAIHDTGIVHRDLKTANIMLDSRDIVRLMDFGIAKEWGTREEDAITGTGDVLGTPEYMSPEQARGLAVDFRGDVYSLGIVFYEILTGRLPFKGETPFATVLQHMNQAPPLEGMVPEPLVPVLARALAKHPAERYGSARGLAAALREAQAAVRKAPPVARARPAEAQLTYTLVDDDAPEVIEADEASGILKALERTDPLLEERIPNLLATLRADDPVARWRAAVALWEAGPAARAAAPALEAVVAEGGPAAEAAAEALKRITREGPRPVASAARPRLEPDPRVPPLLQALQSEDAAARWRAAVALGEIGRGGNGTVPGLAEALDDEVADVRWAAADALAKLGPAAAGAVRSLAAALATRTDEVLRQRAARALAGIGAAAWEGVPALIAALRDREPGLQDAAAEALVKVGPRAVAALVEMVDDEDERVRWKAVDALTRIGLAPPPESGRAGAAS